jgi:threonine aldolase
VYMTDGADNRQHFESDYLEGAHPLIMQRLLETNMEKTPGYGLDTYCERAKEKIRKACGCPQAEVFFLTGGTQTNAAVIDALLRSYQGVVAADSGHISTHEAGAIEFGGHKVLTLPNTYGKLKVGDIERCFSSYYNDINRDHAVMPGMVYISYPTEYGTLYTKGELEQIGGLCRQYGVPLYMDGARLGYGLMARGSDVTLEVIAKNADVFYIGGTKVGALFGEAVVITKPGLIPHFFSIIKQHGALLAKGRMLGIQFDALFTEGLYFEISKHAIDMAEKLKAGLLQKGCRLYFDSPTNQQFLILENKRMEQLAQRVGFTLWEAFDESHSVVRLATSWATREEDIEVLLELV